MVSVKLSEKTHSKLLRVKAKYLIKNRKTIYHDELISQSLDVFDKGLV